MKKENIIVIFYIIYFGWLFTVAFLTPSLKIVNYFTGIVALIYLIFLKEKGDLFIFLTSALIPLAIAAITFRNWQFNFNMEVLYFIPLWLPIAWGTTIVALRKFFLLVSR